MDKCLLGVALLGSFVASATTVTIAPGNGVATNIAGRISGAVDVVVNPGASGGGVVTLGRFNDYTGSTSNGCGTLVATALASEGVHSSLGSAGPLMLGAGTFRYTGPSGAVMGHSVANAFGEEEKSNAVVIDTASDFALGGRWVQRCGALVKKGAGTLTVLGAPGGETNYFGVASSDYFSGFSSSKLKAELEFPPNGDAPTSGYSGLTVAEGTLRIAGGVNLFSQNYGTRIGARYDNGGATPTLELAGGTNVFYGNFQVGCNHMGDSAVLRVTGGDNYLNAAYDSTAQDRKMIRHGCVNGALGILEMTGGSLTVPDANMNFTVSAVNGSQSSTRLSGGTFTIKRSIIAGYAASSSGDLLASDLEVTGKGVLDVAENIQTYNVNANMMFSIAVRDGGTVLAKKIFHNGGRASYPRPQGRLFVDGGVISGRNSNYIFGNADNGEQFADSVLVGSKGMVLQCVKDQTLTVNVPLVATNSVSGQAPLGLTLQSANSGVASFLFTTNNSYAGPTKVLANAQLKLSTGDLPDDSEVSLEAGARLCVSHHARTFKSLTFGESCRYYVTPDAPVTVTDAFRAGGCNVYLKTGTSWSADVSASGVYTVLTVPAADAAELRTFAKAMSAASGCECRGWVETSATTAVLKVQVYGADDARVLDLGDGDVYDVSPQGFDFCRTAGKGYSLSLTTGAVLRATSFNATKVNDPSVRVFLDGGTIQPVFPSGANSYMMNVAELIVGAGGVTFDLSTCCDDPANAQLYLNIKGVFRHAPELGDQPDGGFVVKGGPFMLGGDFVCAFDGPIVVQDGARFSAARDGNGLCTMYNCRVTVLPGAGLETHNEKTLLGADLTLGEADAGDPTFLVFQTNAVSPAVAITNVCQVLSPVQVSIRAGGFPNLPRALSAGTYILLAFNSSISSVNPGLFALNAADHPDASATFEIVDFADAAFPTCDKALVMTCAAKAISNPTWTATASGGAWNTLQNWANTETPPNAASARAAFNPATAAAVPVTLPADGVALHALTLEGGAEKGYALSGGTLALRSHSAQTPTVYATSGSHRVAKLLADGKLQLKTTTNTSSVVSSIEVAALAGSGSVSANTHVTQGAGTVKLGTAGFTGTLTTGSGVTEVDDLSFATSADRLKTGSSTIRYTGPDATFGGFKTNGDRATIFETDANLLALAPATTAGALVKLGGGTLTLGGTGTFAPNKGEGDNANDKKAHANGDMPAGNFYGITVSEGTLAIGVKDDDAHAPTVAPSSSRAIAIGSPLTPADARLACLRLDNGMLTGHDITISFYLTDSPLSGQLTARYEQNGGMADLETYLRTGYSEGKKKIRYEIVVNDGVLDVGSYVSLNFGSPSSANVVTNVFTVNGGTVNVGTYFDGNTAASKSAPTFITLNGGRLSVAGEFNFTKNANSRTVLDLNPGAVFEAGSVVQSKAGGTFNFNGGIFAPLGTESAVLQGLTAANVSTNGAVVDTSKVQGCTYTISQSLAHDARLGEDLDGGLVKQGTGTLVLAAANAFTGVTRIEDGELRLEADGAIPGAVAVEYEGTLDLGGTTRTISTLVRAPGEIRNGTLSLTSGIEIAGDCGDEAETPIVYANLTMANSATLDLGLPDGVDGPSSSMAIPLAYVAGEVTVPGTMKALRSGKVKRFELKLQDGLLWACPMSGGTVLVLR